MSLSLPALTFVLALQFLEVAAGTVYLPGPAFMLERGNGGDGNGSSSTTKSTSSTSSDGKHQSSTTHSSNTHISSSSTSTQSSSTNTHPSSTLTTQSSFTSTTTTTGMVTSSSSDHAITTSSSSSSAPNNVHGSTSAAIQGLSTAARIGLAFGIMFFLILSAMLVCYLKRRSRIAREKAFDRPALLSSEVSQYHPPVPGATPERELPALPPTRLNTAYPNASNISRSHHSANPSITPLLDDSSRNSHSASAWNYYDTLSQEINTRSIITDHMLPLPNPHDPPSASAHTVDHASFTPATPYDASVLASAATTNTFSAPGNSREHPSSSLHTDLIQYQKQLEVEPDKHREAQEELQDPPPEYS